MAVGKRYEIGRIEKKTQAEKLNEEKKQKEAYEQKKSWHKALYDSLEGPKEKFVFD